jgi:hypothetical protein
MKKDLGERRVVQMVQMSDTSTRVLEYVGTRYAGPLYMVLCTAGYQVYSGDAVLFMVHCTTAVLIP